MPVLPRIAEFTLRFWNSGKAFHISQRYWKWLLSLIGMSGISDIHNNYCVLCREQLSLKHIQNSLFFFFNIISSFFSGSQALSALQSIFFIKPDSSVISSTLCLSVSACVFILVVCNMNSVGGERPLVTELFCSVVILKEAISPKPRVKL